MSESPINGRNRRSRAFLKEAEKLTLLIQKGSLYNVEFKLVKKEPKPKTVKKEEF